MKSLNIIALSIALSMIAPVTIIQQSAFAQADNSGINNDNNTQASSLSEENSAISDTMVDSFHAQGTIASMAALQGANHSLIFGGNWALAVVDGKAAGIYVDFTMTSTSGAGRHFMSFSNFRSDDTNIQMNSDITTITGTVDVRESFDPLIPGIRIQIDIINQSVIRISTEDPRISEHFRNQPIYGTVDSIRDDVNNVELLMGP